MMHLPPFPIRLSAGLLAVAAVCAFGATPALRACDACNLSFGQEVAGERAASPLAADVRRAMANQANLRLDGLGNPQIVAALANLPGNAVPAGVGAEISPADLSAPTVVHTGTGVGVGAHFDRPAAPRPLPDYFEGHEFIDIIARDYALDLPPTSYVPQDAPIDKTFTIVLDEGRAYIGNNVVYEGFLTNGTIPGPTLIMNEGDVIEFVVVNRGKVPHGASIHAAYTQTSKYVGKIMPGETKRVVFRANTPGVYMYHCAPGGHAIPMHVLFGQYGMMVVRPKQPYRLEQQLGRSPDVELFLVQHEFYDSGRAAIAGDPRYITFNGKLFRYIEEPVHARPGDYVRIHFLNIGPNLLSTFHIVGIVWDYVYWQGNPAAMLPGGQTVTAGPSDSFTIEFRIPPDEGAYTMLSHAVGSTSRGAIGLIVADRNAAPSGQVLSDGPSHSAAELDAIAAKAVRIISPFQPGSTDLANPTVVGPEVDRVTVSIIGNSFHPKVLQIAPGTTVRWVNEEAFAYLAGEFSGIHNAATIGVEDGFAGPLLAHGESWEYTFTQEGEYPYICTPHPYMKGLIVVKQPKLDLAAITKAAGLAWWVAPALAGSFLLAGLAFVTAARRRE